MSFDLNSDRIDACSIRITQRDIYFTGIVKAATKKKVSYNYKLRLHGQSAGIVNSHCECPADKGPHGTCKHLAAVLLMLCYFVKDGQILVKKSCTEKPQTFHKPDNLQRGSPVKAQNLKTSTTKRLALDDPRPVKFRKMAGYQDHVRNLVINMSSNTNMDITMRFLYEKADLTSALVDHHYMSIPFTEYWIEENVKNSCDEISNIERSTRDQSSCQKWFNERQWRITASRFGEVCKATETRNREKLCPSLVTKTSFSSKAMAHGRIYESIALDQFEIKEKLKVKKCELFVCHEHPYLAATPDGIIDADHIVEVKCPYNGRYKNIEPGPNFPFLLIRVKFN